MSCFWFCVIIFKSLDVCRFSARTFDCCGTPETTLPLLLEVVWTKGALGISSPVLTQGRKRKHRSPMVPAGCCENAKNQC